MDHWTDYLSTHWYVPVTLVGVSLVVNFIRRALRNRPRTRTSAMERLIERNPSIIFDNRWRVSAKRVRFGWVTNLVIAVAVVIATDRPATNVVS